MCGIAGVWEKRALSGQSDMEALTERMRAALKHRGPDDDGVWFDPASGLALANCRLSIIDLSESGRQPMISPSGRLVIVYNGEVYNFAEIRHELEMLGGAFQGGSDTEVILAAVEEWGLEKALSKFVGMFAFALWDKKNRRLHLVRDRVGVKPLYYAFLGQAFVFGSELKALACHPAWEGRIDRRVLSLYLRHNHVPAPYSIYSNVYTLMPGAMLTLDEKTRESASFSPFVRGVGEQADLQPESWWSARDVYEKGARNPFQGTDREAVDHLESLLLRAVGDRMVADVPLGAFLSGGIDSSVVVALMQARAGRPVRTFCIGFTDKNYDEASFAGAMAEHLGTDHTESYATPDDALDVILKLPWLYDEPLADPSQIPTYLVSALARKQVTVCLSGDGGDELFGGYNRYLLTRRLWHMAGWAPGWLKQVLNGMMTATPRWFWERLFVLLRPFFPAIVRNRIPGDMVNKLARILLAGSPQQAYRHLISHFEEPEKVVIGGAEPPQFFSQNERMPEHLDFTKWMMFADLMTRHPDDILVKLDRAGMGVSLETRVPIVDHRVVEFAAGLPENMTIRNRVGKWVLRQVLQKYAPQELIERPKMGFGLPIGNWLKGPLKEWAQELLDEKRLRQDGFFQYESVGRIWSEHLSGKRDWQSRLWVILMFQAWREKWK